MHPPLSSPDAGAGGRSRTSIRGIPPALAAALAAALALSASACTAPSAKQSAAEGPGERAAGAAAGAQKSGAGVEDTGWWQRLRDWHRPGGKPWHYGDARPGKGLLGNDTDGYTLYRQGEAGRSSNPGKPAKVRR